MGVDEKALGQRLQKARQKAGLTQQELCQKAGLSYSTLAKIERGAIKSPSVFTVAAIATATHTSVEKLLNMKELNAAAAAKKTSKSGVQFVYFDVNSTLVYMAEHAFAVIAEQSGMSVDGVEAVYWRYNSEANRGDLTLEEFNKIMADKLNLPQFDWRKYYLDAVQPVPGVAELVRWAAQHYRVGLFTGTMAGLTQALLDSGKLPRVEYEQIIDTSVAKILKPSPKLFELAQSKTGVTTSELLLVDDDRADLIKADELGWQISRFDCYNPEDSIARIREHLAF